MNTDGEGPRTPSQLTRDRTKPFPLLAGVGGTNPEMEKGEPLSAKAVSLDTDRPARDDKYGVDSSTAT